MTTTNEKLRNVADIAARIMLGEKALQPNQQKLDVYEPEKDELTDDDFKKLRADKKDEVKEEAEKHPFVAVHVKKGKHETHGATSYEAAQNAAKHWKLKGTSGIDVYRADKTVATTEDVDLDESKMAQLDADLKDLSHDAFTKEYGKPKHHYDPSNFKKPVQKGQEMNRAKSLAQRAMQAHTTEDVEELDEYTSTAGGYKHKGTYGTEKSAESGYTDYDKENEIAKKLDKPDKPVKKGARQNRNFNTKLYKEGFTSMLASYTDHGLKGITEQCVSETTDESADYTKFDVLVRAGLGNKAQIQRLHSILDRMGEEKPNFGQADRMIIQNVFTKMVDLITNNKQIFTQARRSIKEELDPKTKEVHASQDLGFTHGNSSDGNKNPHDRKNQPDHHSAYEYGYDEGQHERRSSSM